MSVIERQPTIKKPKLDIFDKAMSSDESCIVAVSLPIDMRMLPRVRPCQCNHASTHACASQVRFDRKEFDELFNDVKDVLMLARNHDDIYGEELNSARRSHAYKYSPKERLFIFLVYVHEYPTFRALERQTNLKRRPRCSPTSYGSAVSWWSIQ